MARGELKIWMEKHNQNDLSEFKSFIQVKDPDDDHEVRDAAWDVIEVIIEEHGELFVSGRALLNFDDYDILYEFSFEREDEDFENCQITIH